MADTAIEFVKDKLSLLRSKLDQIPILQDVEEKTKIPKEYLVIVGGIVFATIVFFGVAAGSMCSFIGFIYPAYQSFKAIENKNKGDDIQWLVYWVLYAFFAIIETFQDFILYWIPFYFSGKLAFLLWAMLPQTRGAKVLYDSFLKDFLKKTSDDRPSRIDAAMADAKKSSDTTAAELAGTGVADLSKGSTMKKVE